MIPEQQRLLETFTLLVASALERLTLTASEEQARLNSERESLRNPAAGGNSPMIYARR